MKMHVDDEVKRIVITAAKVIREEIRHLNSYYFVLE